MEVRNNRLAWRRFYRSFDRSIDEAVIIIKCCRLRRCEKTNSHSRRNVLINIDWLKRGVRSVSSGAKVLFRASNNQRRTRRKAVQPSDKIESNDTSSNYYFDRRAVRTNYAEGEKNRGIESHIRPEWLMAFDRTDSTPCLPVSRISFRPWLHR